MNIRNKKCNNLLPFLLKSLNLHIYPLDNIDTSSEVFAADQLFKKQLVHIDTAFIPYFLCGKIEFYAVLGYIIYNLIKFIVELCYALKVIYSNFIFISNEYLIIIHYLNTFIATVNFL